MEESKYFIGLDIGSDSVGYAAAKEDYSLCKNKGEPMWGSHLFDAANQSAERRTFRTSRRRLDRRQQRIKFLQELFAPEIAKVDERFFIRIKESALLREDKSLPDDVNSIFCDASFSDRDYHKNYPTIHHLICDLMEDCKDKDIRLIYLAIAWMVAHRGHFLSEIDVDDIDKIYDFEPLYQKFVNWFYENDIEMPWNCKGEDFADIVKQKKGVTEKKKTFSELLFAGKTPKDNKELYPISRSELIVLFSGGSTHVNKLIIGDEAYEEISDTLSFNGKEEELEAVIGQLGDYGDLVRSMKEIFDWGVLCDLLKSGRSISAAKVAEYQKHKEDLAKLKKLVKKYAVKEYNGLFRGAEKDGYSAYVYNFKSVKDEHSKLPKGKASYEEFTKKVKGIIEKIKSSVPEESEDMSILQEINTDIANAAFMPKQVNGNNRVIPYQLYAYELKKILENVEKEYPVFTEKDEDGFSLSDKIYSIFTFRIPYYVGPLNGYKNKNYWLIRKKEGRICPWNFSDMVDEDKSEQEFINRMTNQCSYIPGEDVLPKYSFLYCRYTVLNEINNIKVDGTPISVEAKQKLYNEVFCPGNGNKYKVTRKKVDDFLYKNRYAFKGESSIGGLDTDVKSNLKPLFDFERLLSSSVLSMDDVERIIIQRTYTESNFRFKKWLKENYELSESDCNYISGTRYSAFGRLSAELLNGIEGVKKETGEIGTVIHFLWETNDNLMQIIADEKKYTFAEQIRTLNEQYYSEHPMDINERLDDMGITNAVKRPVIRTLDIVSDIVKVAGHEPEKIFVEMARDISSADKKGKRTVSRKNQLLELYKNINDEQLPLLKKQLDELGDDADNKLQSEALFLYFCQLGRCMYCWKPIEISLIKTNEYNIDHIWPQSFVKDDSILNNKVLVHSTENGNKGDIYPLPAEWRNRMHSYWEMLRKNGLITEEKYKRLTRNTPFTDSEKLGFINRQLVETRQATKAVTEILQEKYPESKIVFVKAGLVSDFRHEYGAIKNKAYDGHYSNSEMKDMELIKCRSVNDLHHAKDAYLNIVVGNVYDEKFTNRWFNVSTSKYSLNTDTLFGRKIERNEALWNPEIHLKTVDKVMANNHIHLTKYQTCQKGGLFDQMPIKAGESDIVPRKKGLDPAKYGGYNKSTAAFFALVSHIYGKKKELTIMPIDLMIADKFKNDPSFALGYAQKTLGEKSKNISFPLGNRILKINTVFSLDGFEVCLTGKSNGGSRVLMRSLSSFYMDEWNCYIKKIDNYFDRKSKDKTYNPDFDYLGITKENNTDLFRGICLKYNSDFFSKLPGNKPILNEEKIREFEKQSIENQLSCLVSSVSALKTNRAGSCDFTSIGYGKNVSSVYLNANISNWNYSDIRIIDRTASGLFEKKSMNLKEML